MKHKKLFTFMIIVSTLLVCCTMDISASDIWDSKEETYVLEGWQFEQLDDMYEVPFIDSPYRAYIINETHGKMYVLFKLDIGYYRFGNDHAEIETTVDDLIIYINKPLYEYWLSEEGNVPTIEIIEEKSGAKDVFNIAVNTTRDVAFGFFEAIWNDGLTFWGWLIAMAFGLITTFNIIKMISNSL